MKVVIINHTCLRYVNLQKEFSLLGGGDKTLSLESAPVHVPTPFIGINDDHWYQFWAF